LKSAKKDGMPFSQEMAKNKEKRIYYFDLMNFFCNSNQLEECIHKVANYRYWSDRESGFKQKNLFREIPVPVRSE
jgi:hypothetical protein